MLSFPVLVALALVPGDIEVVAKDDQVIELTVKFNAGNPRDRKIALEALGRMMRETSRNSVEITAAGNQVPEGKAVDGKVAIADLMAATPQARFIRDLQDPARAEPIAPPRELPPDGQSVSESAWIPWYLVIPVVAVVLLGVFGLGALTHRQFSPVRVITRAPNREENEADRARRQELDRRAGALEAEIEQRGRQLLETLRVELRDQEAELRRSASEQGQRQLQLDEAAVLVRRGEEQLEVDLRELTQQRAELQRERQLHEPVAARVARLESVLSQINGWAACLETDEKSDKLEAVRILLERYLAADGQRPAEGAATTAT